MQEDVRPHAINCPECGSEMRIDWMESKCHCDGCHKTITMVYAAPPDNPDHDIDVTELIESISRNVRERLPNPDLMMPKIKPHRRAGPTSGRNDPCPCGSGKKRKRCDHGES